MKLFKLLGAAALTALVAGPLAAAPKRAPRVHVQTIADLAPLPLPYDEKADANRDVAKARAQAKAHRKLRLIDLGGNWCADCRILASVMEQPEMRPFMKQHYELVTVDVGRFDKNMAIAERYGFKKLEGVPALLIVDPSSNRLINGKSIFALADARSMTPQALADWLAKWTR